MIHPGPPVAERQTIPRRLDALQALVGGPIELLTLGPGRAAYLHEEGKFAGLMPNIAGEALIRVALATDGRELHPDDHIVGPVVLTGGFDADGNDLSVTDVVTGLCADMSITIVPRPGDSTEGSN